MSRIKGIHTKDEITEAIDLTAPATPEFIELANKQVLASYAAQPSLIEEQAKLELATSTGAYGRRQVYELIQNAADALRETDTKGRIQLILTDHALYCANEGKPITVGGVRAILQSFLSQKSGNEIGRYGLGFKSVLGVSDKPEFYGTHVSFRFDPAWAAKLIKKTVNYTRLTPTLRLAATADRELAANEDPILKELFLWATSVVKLPFRDKRHQWLSEDISTFPGEFLLFSPSVGNLSLEDRSSSPIGFNVKPEPRLITRSESNPVKVVDNDRTSLWHVFHKRITPTKEAVLDGGHFAGRESVDLFWAVQADGGTRDGRFWAYFPLEKESMSLRGIVNAAWKLNEDRQNILEGTFNDELIQHVVDIAFDNMGELVDSTNPGKILEIYPGRLAERTGADRRLTEAFYKLAKQFPTIPDTAGVLRRPPELELPPYGSLPAGAIKAWDECPYKPIDWAHPTVIENTTRSARIDYLLIAGKRRATVKQWLEALVSDENIRVACADGTVSENEAKITCSFFAVKAAAAFLADDSIIVGYKNEARSAHTVLTADNEFVSLQQDTIFLPAQADLKYEGVNVLHPRLVELLENNELLDTLGIATVDAASQLKAKLSTRHQSPFNQNDWAILWGLVGKVEGDSQTTGLSSTILYEHFADENPGKSVHVKTKAGNFKPLSATLMPGNIVSGEGHTDEEVAVDVDFHSSHLQVLKNLGAVSTPVPGGGDKTELWFVQYRAEAEQAFFRGLSTSHSRPALKYLDFREHKFTGPLEPILRLGKEARCRFTEHLLQLSDEDRHWSFQHSSRGGYPTITVDSPVFWMIKKYGRLRTYQGTAPTSEAVGPTLKQWSEILPVASISENLASSLGLPKSFDELSSEQFETAFERAPEIKDNVLLGSFYAKCSESVAAPQKIWCIKGSSSGWFSLQDVTVAIDRHLNDAVEETLRALNIPFIEVKTAEEEKLLRERWGLKSAETSFSFEVKPVPSGSEIPVGDYFKGLSLKLNASQINLKLIPCSSIRIEIITETGTKSEERDFLEQDTNLFYSDSLTREQLLDRVVQALSLSITSYERDGILNNIETEENRKKRLKIRVTGTLPEKLLMCVSEPGVLRRRLSDNLLEAYSIEYGEITDEKCAEIFLSVYGVESLRLLKDELTIAGMDVPARWAGSYAARKFVRDLGFPVEFAGFEKSEREAEIDVPGPRQLPPLHDFQLTAVSRIKSLLLSGEKKRRGLLSLPTGAGKTRVAVEAVIRTIRDDGFPSPVLWIAQTDELCEQAVQTWSEIWHSVGTSVSLRINRLWKQNEADEWSDGPQVVIATIAKLRHVNKDPDYDWLKRCTLVIIDEAHESISSEYTAILEWLGVSRKSDRCPLLGLTATAFRGGQQETQRLVGRYNNNRLDTGILGDDPYGRLQEWEVLAKVSHKLLDGADIDLTDSELESLRQMHSIPTSALNRLGEDVKRNLRIINAVKDLPADWPVLLFTVSVDNARTIAALLNSDGISSAAISAETDDGARRHYIEEFRKGRIRVLTNYGVLTTGFDAPAVRAVIVGRPTFSPVRYQQMIGRGLRGPRNNGKSECLIINVKDNFLRFGEDLAFKEFDYLWSES